VYRLVSRGFPVFLFADLQALESKSDEQMQHCANNRVMDLRNVWTHEIFPVFPRRTHTIANIICAYLCRGKRVLVTSKNAPALSVLRGRLPESVRELVVDVSMSELSGMRQLQKTVERLANRVASSNPDIERKKCEFLQVSRCESFFEIYSMIFFCFANAFGIFFCRKTSVIWRSN